MIILEGPDGGGKTFLANRLLDLMPSGVDHVDHHGPYLGHDAAQLMATYLQSVKSADIMDRCWLSENIYANEFRGDIGRLSSVDELTLESFALERGATVICCLPSMNTMLKTWRGRRSKEYVTNEAALRRVWTRYAFLHQTSTIPVLYWNRDLQNGENDASLKRFKSLV